MKQLRALVLITAVALGIATANHFHNPLAGFLAANAVCAAHFIRQRGYSFGADFYADGDFPFGSEIVTIQGVDYVAEDLNPVESSSSKDRKDEKGRPNGALYQREKTKISGTLQLATLTTPIPEMLTVAVMPFRGAPKRFLVTQVGQPKKQDDIRKLQVELTELLN